MIQIEGYFTMDTMVTEALENETQRVSILHRMQIFIERMVGRSRYACQARPSRSQITYTQHVKHQPDETRPSQSDAIARRTRHRGNEEEAGLSHKQSGSQTALARGHGQGRG